MTKTCSKKQPSTLGPRVMDDDMLLAQKIQTAKMKLLTAWDSAHVAQYEHYLMSNMCLFCIDEGSTCDGAPEGDTNDNSEGKKNNPPGEPRH